MGWRERPYGHLTDEQVREGLERARRGEPSGHTVYAGPPETWPSTGLEHWTDAEVEERLDEAADQVRRRLRRED